MIRQYYRVEFELISAMNIGCGSNDNSDSDIIRDSRNEPYIPGSTIAGIFRSLLDEKTRKLYMGDVVINKDAGGTVGNNSSESKLIIYDAFLKREEGKETVYQTSVRDCVALDEFKTAKAGAKFDFEILEPGCTFVTFIEQDMAEGDENIALNLVSTWKEYGLTFGSKTMRGLGNTKVISIKQAEFDLKTDLEKWLNFNVYDDKCWEDELEDTGLKPLTQHKIVLDLRLKQVSGISVRKYTTRINEKTDTQPDYEQLCSYRFKYKKIKSSNKGKKKGKGKVSTNIIKEAITVPIVPGSSWAGTFRHHLKTLGVCQNMIDDMFGYVNGDDSQKARLSFSESELTGGKEKMITRNAIDRFTCGTVNGALYTECFYFGGNGELKITLLQDLVPELQQALAASIADLHLGMLAVGGLTSVGRGLFEITKINEKEINPEMTAKEVYDLALKAITLPKGEDENV